MRYKIVTGRNLPDLESAVNSLLKHMWKPTGGLMVQGSLYAQALVLEEEKIEKAKEKSWGKGVDRMSGAFDDEEIISSLRERW